MVVYILCKECVLLSISGSDSVFHPSRLQTDHISYTLSCLLASAMPGHEATNTQEYTALTQDSMEHAQNCKKLKIHQMRTLTIYKAQGLYSHLQDCKCLGLGRQGYI